MIHLSAAASFVCTRDRLRDAAARVPRPRLPMDPYISLLSSMDAAVTCGNDTTIVGFAGCGKIISFISLYSMSVLNVTSHITFPIAKMTII